MNMGTYDPSVRILGLQARERIAGSVCGGVPGIQVQGPLYSSRNNGDELIEIITLTPSWAGHSCWKRVRRSLGPAPKGDRERRQVPAGPKTPLYSSSLDRARTGAGHKNNFLQPYRFRNNGRGVASRFLDRRKSHSFQRRLLTRLAGGC